ncbi:MAG: NADP-dependent malic enzyme [Proteobacteria bacterium]|nr:NADP-dependent malic enzyme [Pseudomonadota bacterium]
MTRKQTAGNALLYHALPRPGKLEVVPTKPLTTQEDLSLAYTPGVAEVCLEIANSPETASSLTTKGNLVAVITNGTAVLGLGNIGALAGKPVMEGKAVLFKKFANIDVFDIEVKETDPDKFITIVEALEPTFGGINLEDIKGPECFYIEQELERRMNIPVFHDDQHGTAIIVTAAVMNGLELTGKDKNKIKIVCSGAGAAGVSCMRMLVAAGFPKKNITMVDINGVIYKGRNEMNDVIAEFAQDTKMRTLGEAVDGADVFIGVSAGGILKKDMVAKMAAKPLIFAMANPTPEITPEEVLEVRDDAIIGTGRSDYPNQINNVLCFPYVFRGALDVGATHINIQMKLAAAEALAALARKEADATLDNVYQNSTLRFGPDYIIPKPFDPRLIATVAPAVARAAMETGVATRPIEDIQQYANSLKGSFDQSFSIMRQIYNNAVNDPKRVVYPDGEDPRVVRAAQSIINEGIAHPMLIGNPDVVQKLVREHGLSMREGKDYTLIDPKKYARVPDYVQIYYNMRKRDGILPPEAEIIMRYRWAALASMMLREGDADAMVAGATGKFDKFLRQAQQIIGQREDVLGVYALQLFMRKGRVFFMGDTNVNVDPTAEQIAEMTLLASETIRRFGITPRAALLSHSHFGSANDKPARKMRTALGLIQARDPDLEVDGEMQADAALNMKIMRKTFPDSRLQEEANLLVMPSMDAASIAFNLMRSMTTSGEHVGPILLGMNKPVHILSIYCTVRQIVNLTALAVVEAQGSEATFQDSAA